MILQLCKNVPAEEALRKEGFIVIAGVDEAGRGPLAGPVVAAAVVLPFDGPGLDSLPFPMDCKLFQPPRREKLFSIVTSLALVWSTGRVDAEAIDEINILRASLRAMRLAAEGIAAGIDPQLFLVDGNHDPGLPRPTRCLVKGDRLSLSIGAASIVAKVVRDRIMDGYHDEFPQYGFDRHRGYGTRAHLDALRRHGPCPIHRRTFRGVG